MQHRYIRRIVGPGAFLAVALLALGGCDSAEQDPCPPHIPSCGNPAYFNHPAWHPSGATIAASHADTLDMDGDGVPETRFSGIWLIDAETGEIAPLLNGFFQAAWRPDGRALAVEQGGQIYTIEVEGAEDIATARADTTTLRRLTNEGANFWPFWSPDGQFVAYESNLNDPVGGYALWTVRSDGEESQRIIKGRQGAWSTDGRFLVHTGLYGDFYRVEIERPENDERITYLNGTGESSLTLRRPRYSPDGSRIAFQVVGAPAVRIHVMNTDGSGLHPIGPEDAYAFDWSPDGSRIVFLYLDRTYDPNSGQLWTMQSDGSDARPLTHFTPSTNTP